MEECAKSNAFCVCSSSCQFSAFSKVLATFYGVEGHEIHNFARDLPQFRTINDNQLKFRNQLKSDLKKRKNRGT